MALRQIVLLLCSDSGESANTSSSRIVSISDLASTISHYLISISSYFYHQSSSWTWTWLFTVMSVTQLLSIYSILYGSRSSFVLTSDSHQVVKQKNHLNWCAVSSYCACHQHSSIALIYPPARYRSKSIFRVHDLCQQSSK